jgi:hypothetical protein
VPDWSFAFPKEFVQEIRNTRTDKWQFDAVLPWMLQKLPRKTSEIKGDKKDPAIRSKFVVYARDRGAGTAEFFMKDVEIKKELLSMSGNRNSYQCKVKNKSNKERCPE